MTLSTSVRKPGVYIDENVTGALQGLYPVSDSVVVIAQKLAAGTADATTPVKCFSDADAALYFGSGSVAHLAVKAAFLQNPSISGYTVLGLVDAATAVDATGTITLTAPPSAGGTLRVYVGDELLSYGYSAGDTTATVVNGLMTDASSKVLPVILTHTANAIKAVARNRGRCGNMIPLSASDANGTSWVTITAMANGANDPDVGAYGTPGTALAAIVGGKYTVIVNCVPNNVADHASMTKIQTMVTFLSGQTEQAPCIQVFSMTDLLDTYANVKALCGTTGNSGRCTCAYLTYANTDGAASEYFKVAAAYAADIVAQSDPSLPYNGDVLVPIAPPSVADRLSRTQQEDLLWNGVTPLEVVSGELVAIVKAISTYTTNGSGSPDPTLLNIETYRTLDYVRAQLRTKYQSNYGKSKITARLLNSIIDTTYNTLKLIELLEIVKDVDTYKTAITAVVNPANPSRVDVKVPTAIVSPLDIIAGELDLIIS